MKYLICAVGVATLAALPASASTAYGFGTIGGNNSGNGISLASESYVAGSWTEDTANTGQNIACVVSFTTTTHICGFPGPTNAVSVPIPADPGGTAGGSNFFIEDADPHYGAPISADLTGLISGDSYTVSFYQATSEEIGPTPTQYTDTWLPYLLPTSFSSGTYICPFAYCNTNSTETAAPTGSTLFTIPSMLNTPATGPAAPVSTPWEQESFTFTASAGSQVLEFVTEAVGNTPFQPPMLALADVTVTQNSTTPEPGTWQLTMLGAGVIFAASRLRRRFGARS